MPERIVGYDIIRLDEHARNHTEFSKLTQNVHAAVYTLSGLHTVLNAVTKLSFKR